MSSPRNEPFCRDEGNRKKSDDSEGGNALQGTSRGSKRMRNISPRHRNGQMTLQEGERAGKDDVLERFEPKKEPYERNKTYPEESILGNCARSML